MKSSSEITAKLVAATLLAGVFNLSQVEACEGLRKNPVKELMKVADTAGAPKNFVPPSDMAARDERKEITKSLSPVGEMTLSSFSKRKGSGTLIPGPNGKACYVLTSLHILPDGSGVSSSPGGPEPTLLGKSFEKLRSEGLDKVVYRTGDKLDKVFEGKIVGGGEATLLPRPENADEDYVDKYEISPSKDYVLVRLNESVSNQIAKPVVLDREIDLVESKRTETSGIPTDKNKEQSANPKRYGGACSAITNNWDNDFYVNYNCTATPRMSGGAVTYTNKKQQEVLMTILTEKWVRELTPVDSKGERFPLPAEDSSARGPSIAQISTHLDQLMKKYPCQ
jgi:hypothetical protein